jgi:hypothetical protein
VTAAGKTLYSGEVGWPTNAIAGGDITANGSIASVPNAQIFLDTFVCQANSNITAGGPYDVGYFWFGMYHPTEPSKAILTFIRSF